MDMPYVCMISAFANAVITSAGDFGDGGKVSARMRYKLRRAVYHDGGFGKSTLFLILEWNLLLVCVCVCLWGGGGKGKTYSRIVE